MYPVTDGQFQLVYNILSFSLASMMASTVFFWMRVPAVGKKYQTALLISGLVTFIAAYHYMRIFNSWTEAYAYSLGKDGQPEGPHPTGVPFNDAYRYMDWLLTVPMLLMEIVLTMKLTAEESKAACTQLGVASALMIIAGYPGELIIAQDQLATRWKYWAFAMLPFLYVVYSLLIGLSAARQAETRDSVRELIFRAQWVTVVSWLTYPVVYVFPMIGFSGAGAVVGIQVGYCCSDVISKCGVGFIIYGITSAKSAQDQEEGLLK